MDIIRQIYYKLTPELRLVIRRIFYAPYDLWQLISGKGDILMPPKGLIFIGSGDFIATGKYFLNKFITECAFKPSDKILDVGCGVGRIAIPLTSYINSNGHYDGFDIVKSGIDWCKKNITKRYPNFHFLHVSLSNDLYNLQTTKKSSTFTFPYANENYDLVVATSLFTHMMPEDTEHYLKEIHRVLKTGGRCLCTFFLFKDSSNETFIGHSSFKFPYNFGHYALMDKKVKEANVAYNEEYIRNFLLTNGFSITKVTYGFWSSQKEGQAKDFQDTLIIVKNS